MVESLWFIRVQDSCEEIVVEQQGLRKRHLAYDARLLYVGA